MMIEGEPIFEEEKNPEKVRSDAVSKIENKDAADPITGSYWSNKAKEFFSPSENWKDLETTGIVAGVSLGALLFLSAKIVQGAFKFGKKAIEKKGDVGFGEGYKIGEEIFSFSDKKGDKK